MKPTAVDVSVRLRASPTFSLNFSMDGRPYVAKDTEPYVQFWLSERERLLLGIFSSRRGETIASAIDNYWRIANRQHSSIVERELRKTIAQMQEAGVLVDHREDVSRYSRRMVPDYLIFRPFPPEIAQQVIASAPIGPQTRVLDLAGGPGDLALQLAHASDQVTLMELSTGFVRAARDRAKKAKRPLETLQESCNRLVFGSGEYDVVTVAQALHWLDDVAVCRGLCKLLAADGSFFVIHSAFDVPDAHPLAHIFGRRSVLGAVADRSFAESVEAIRRRLSLLFEALDAPDVDRVDPAQRRDLESRNLRIVPVAASLYEQCRPMGMGFARAFLSDSHIAPTGLTPAVFWKELEKRCRGLGSPDIAGTFNWAVLQFRRTADRPVVTPLAEMSVQELPYHGPSEV